MSEKRRDNKGRLLRNGEYQRSDGKYEYKYFDAKGERRSVYSWKLVESDPTPKGHRSGKALRDLIEEIEQDTRDKIDGYTANRTTLNEYFDLYIQTKLNLRSSTKTNYIYMYNKYVRDEIGYKTLSSFKHTDIKKFYLSLIHEKHFKPNSMEIINTILHPVFGMAVLDDYIRKNPATGVMAEIKKSHAWEKKKRHALTKEQQKAFVNFVANSSTFRHFLPLFTVLLGTGCRIGECLGLQWEDCDFEKNIITIQRNLIYRQHEDGRCYFDMNLPKTSSGIRMIPMLDEVRAALLTEKEKRAASDIEIEPVGGFSNFVFVNRYGQAMSPHCVNRAIERIIEAYNKAEKKAAKEEKRLPVLLPHFSAHNLRHTFCTRFCENETNLKVIQEIMGHADITTTMEIYNEATAEAKAESFANLQGKITIA